MQAIDGEPKAKTLTTYRYTHKALLRSYIDSSRRGKNQRPRSLVSRRAFGGRVPKNKSDTKSDEKRPAKQHCVHIWTAMVSTLKLQCARLRRSRDVGACLIQDLRTTTRYPSSRFLRAKRKRTGFELARNSPMASLSIKPGGVYRKNAATLFAVGGVERTLIFYKKKLQTKKSQTLHMYCIIAQYYESYVRHQMHSSKWSNCGRSKYDKHTKCQIMKSSDEKDKIWRCSVSSVKVKRVLVAWHKNEIAAHGLLANSTTAASAHLRWQ